MERKKVINCIIISLILLVLVSFVSASAIIGAIGNGKMVLNENEYGDSIQEGDMIREYVVIENPSDYVLDIELFHSGHLEEYVEIIDESFTLQPGEEKKAYFTIKSDKEGTYESFINIKFTPEDKGNGVGLSSTVIAIVNANTKS